ncbi:hypothetical protein IV203_036477 [Nitzschia inconspicua]|uniref:Uncharacterized protein n=1 Tax=Nitzschia inconspicua TaxID=303405 RepID=A0A9K3PVK1_9STRA|nr:hypothetical protein IV203_036477 [Nitzschia inconspicua]
MVIAMKAAKAKTKTALDTEIWKTEVIGLKLGFYRCNAAKIAKKQVRKSRRHQHGNLRYYGEIKRKKGDCYIVDCVVTGSDQAPQMPHANNLDLAIFPSMSHRHSSLISEYSNTKAPADQIWKAALSLLNALANSTIARGSVLAKRIHREEINSKGDNTFLPTKNYHAGVKSDF